jgi:hypothetical protein
MIRDGMIKVLRALAGKKRDAMHEALMTGPELTEITGMIEVDIKDAVTLLVEKGFAKWTPLSPALPYGFHDVWITPSGRLEAESGDHTPPTVLSPLKVLVSSTMLDLQKEREAADKVIQEPMYIRYRAETMPSSGMASKEVCARMAKDCDLVLLIIGAIYGEIVPGEEVSFTEFEYNQAKLIDPTKVLAFVKDIPASLREERQNAFLKKVRDAEKGHFTAKPFKNDLELAQQIKNGIADWLIERARTVKRLTTILDSVSATATEFHRSVLSRIDPIWPYKDTDEKYIWFATVPLLGDAQLNKDQKDWVQHNGVGLLQSRIFSDERLRDGWFMLFVADKQDGNKMEFIKVLKNRTIEMATKYCYGLMGKSFHPQMFRKFLTVNLKFTQTYFLDCLKCPREYRVRSYVGASNILGAQRDVILPQGTIMVQPIRPFSFEGDILSSEESKVEDLLEGNLFNKLYRDLLLQSELDPDGWGPF